MTGMFKVSDPGEARGNTITAREILDRASKDIHTSLAKGPEVQAQMMHVMGGVYDNLGLYPQAQYLYADAVGIRKRRRVQGRRRQTAGRLRPAGRGATPVVGIGFSESLEKPAWGALQERDLDAQRLPRLQFRGHCG